MNGEICIVLTVYREPDPQAFAERLRAVAAQTEGRFVCLVADNAPLSRAPYTADIPFPDGRFVLLRTGGGSEAHAKNLALDRADRPWILFSEEGILLPNAVETLCEAAEVSRADLVYGGWYERTADGVYRDRPFPYDGAVDSCDLTDRLILPLCCDRYRAGRRQIPTAVGAAGHALIRTEAISRTGAAFREEVPDSGLWFDLDLLFGGAHAACVRDCLQLLPSRTVAWHEYTSLHRELWDYLRETGVSRAAQRQFRAQLWHRARSILRDPNRSDAERREVLSDPILRLFCRHPSGIPPIERISARLCLPWIADAVRQGIRPCKWAKALLPRSF